MEKDHNDDATIPSPEEPEGAEVFTPNSDEFIEVEAVEPPAGTVRPAQSVSSESEPPLQGEVPNYEGQVSSTPPQKKNNRKIWIIVAVVVVLLCCCCLLIALAVINMSDSNEFYEFQEYFEDFSNLFHVAPAYVKAWLAA